MPARFFYPGEWGDVVELPQTEAEHFARVLRGQSGDAISLFNGRGEIAEGIVERVSKRNVDVRIRSVTTLPPVPNPQVSIAVAPPKGDWLRWMIEKATELGIDEVLPLKTERGVVSPSETKLGKLEQTMLAACKQSGRSRVMAIKEPCSLNDLLTECSTTDCSLLFGSPAASSLASLAAAGLRGRERVVVVIGPEGGLTSEEEQQLLEAGATAVSLSPHILRVETAALAAASWLIGLRLLG